jgi:dTDP-glucose 4,6-dehydratase
MCDCATWVWATLVVVGSWCDFALNQILWSGVVRYIVIACLLQVMIGMIFMLYRGRYRSASFEESLGPGLAVFFVGGLLALIFVGIVDGRTFPRPTAALVPPVALLIMAASRWAHRAWRERSGDASGAEKVLIYGAGYAADQLLRLDRSLRDLQTNAVRRLRLNEPGSQIRADVLFRQLSEI